MAESLIYAWIGLKIIDLEMNFFVANKAVLQLNESAVLN